MQCHPPLEAIIFQNNSKILAVSWHCLSFLVQFAHLFCTYEHFIIHLHLILIIHLNFLLMKKVFLLVFYFFACLYAQSVFFGKTDKPKGNQILSVKILPGAIIGDFSGSLGSTTFSHNKGGAYLKNKSIPTNQQSPAQIAVRATLANLSSAWRALLAAERTAWDVFSASIPKSGPFGLPKYLTGHQMFISCNQNLNKVTAANISTPGSVPSITSEASVNVNAAGGAGTMTLQFPTAIVLGELMYVRMSPPLSAGLKSPKNVCKFVTILNDVNLSPFDVVAAYEAVYGVGWQTAVGDKIFAEISVVDTASGLTTQYTLGGDVIAV